MLIRKFKSTHIGYQDQNLPKLKIDMIFYYRCAVYQWISLTSVEQPTGQMKILYLFTQLKPSNDKQEQTINFFLWRQSQCTASRQRRQREIRLNFQTSLNYKPIPLELDISYYPYIFWFFIVTTDLKQK